MSLMPEWNPHEEHRKEALRRLEAADSFPQMAKQEATDNGHDPFDELMLWRSRYTWRVQIKEIERWVAAELGQHCDDPGCSLRAGCISR